MVRQRSGSVVNTTSSSLMGRPSIAVYGGTKAALLSVTYSWAIDMGGHGVRVNAFSPSARTRMTAGASNGVTGQPTAEANAPVVTYLLSDHSAGITGQAVQLERDRLIVMNPARLSDIAAVIPSACLSDVVEHFDPVLRSNLQPVGWWPDRGPALETPRT
jgi:NAD(P)-dependent dehydrogenase (short-subunit alcohol dehydrogenase family)